MGQQLGDLHLVYLIAPCWQSKVSVTHGEVWLISFWLICSSHIARSLHIHIHTSGMGSFLTRWEQARYRWGVSILWVTGCPGPRSQPILTRARLTPAWLVGLSAVLLPVRTGWLSFPQLLIRSSQQCLDGKQVHSLTDRFCMMRLPRTISAGLK